MVIQLRCKKQTCVALSTQEAEYIAGAELCKNLLGLLQFFQEINVYVKSPTIVWMDNTQGIKQIEQETSSAKLKHVDMKYKFLCERAKKRDVMWCPSMSRVKIKLQISLRNPSFVNFVVCDDEERSRGVY
jgi:hypothetical protein